ncbi:MAG: hypothetical protein ACPG46_01675 [Thalassotalea sp.]
MLLILACASYYGALHVPLYVDDSVVLYSAGQVPWPDSLIQWINSRYVGLKSFTLSKPFDNALPAIHLVTLVLHVINALLIYLLVKGLSSALSLASFNRERQQQSVGLAALSALIWLCHPLNSQAVVYISQRFTVLALFFSLLTIIFFIKALQNKSVKKKSLFAIFSLVFFILALGSKQSVIFLPAFLYILSVFILVRYRVKLLLAGVTFLLVCLAFAYYMPELLSTIDNLTRETQSYSRLDYFATQLQVVLQYFSLLFYPANLRLEADINLVLFNSAEFYYYLTIHLALIATVLVFSWRYKQPLTLFALVLIYLGLAVESSFIPIQDLYFEHRMYLPSIGVIIIVLNMAKVLFSAVNVPNKVQFIIACFLTVGLCYLTSVRVQQWQAPLSFYQLELEKSPNSTRAMSSYGKELAKHGQKKQALDLILKSYNLEIEQGIIRQANIVGLLSVLVDIGYYQDALNLGRRAINYTQGRPKLQSLVYSHLALVYYKMKQCGFAKGWSTKALKLDRTNGLAQQLISMCN